ncbi:ubiquitin-specific protease ubp15 [Marasmius crinis-equi]|uniref:Ubiquitin-specific protease ubp15 n=1 Tax=Marasmius crinis-equi TaxID=585013 RepID=A0ABR3EW90_9AGAR
MVAPNEVAQFLDLEADVDEEEEEQGTDGAETEDFIVPDGDNDEFCSSTTPTFGRQSEARDDAKEAEDLTASLLRRYQRTHEQDPAADDMRLEKLALLRTRPQLWKVKCIKGEEYSVCHYVLTSSQSPNETPISSIFYRSDRDGYVIVELTNLNLAAQLLASHSCVARGSPSQPSGIDMVVLEENEAETALELPADPLQRPGTWARFVRPRFLPASEAFPNYDGDPCLIDEVRWPFAQVFVVPRIEAFHVTLGQENERAEGCVQTLHTPETLTPEYYASTIHRANPSFRGLYLLRVHMRHLRVLQGPLPRKAASLFLASQYKGVLENFPRVLGWEFKLGKLVRSSLSGAVGTISAVYLHGVDITSQPSTDCTACEASFGGWALHKRWRVGDYLRHYQGLEGWVVEVNGTTLKLVSRYTDLATGLLRLDRFSGHTNSFVAATPPYDWQSMSIAQPVNANNQSKMPDGLTAARTFRAPWKWKDVILWRGKHHGTNYRVFDVLLSDQTASGMRVQVETTIANSPLQRILVDYDDVVDRGTLLPLHIIEDPTSPAFRPDPPYRHPAIDKLKSIHITAVSPQSPPPTRPATPPYTSALEATAADAPEAWNPEFRDREDPGAEYALAKARELEAFHVSQHPFLEILRCVTESATFKFNVKLTGTSQVTKKDFRAAAKEIDVVEYEGKRQLAFQHYKRTVHVHPTVTVEPEFPTKHTQKPLFVLKGPAEGTIGARVGCSGDLLQVVRVDLKPVRVYPEQSIGVKPEDCCTLSVKAYITDELNLKLKDLLPAPQAEIIDSTTYSWPLEDTGPLWRNEPVTSPEFSCGGYNWQIIFATYGAWKPSTGLLNNPRPEVFKNITAVSIARTSGSTADIGNPCDVQYGILVASDMEPSVWTSDVSTSRFFGNEDWGFARAGMLRDLHAAGQLKNSNHQLHLRITVHMRVLAGKASKGGSLLGAVGGGMST